MTEKQPTKTARETAAQADDVEKKAKKARSAAADLKKYRLFTLTELVPLLGISKATLRWFIKTGALEGRLIAGRIRVSQAALDKFLANAEGIRAEPATYRAERAAAKENYKKTAAEDFCELFPDEAEQASGTAADEKSGATDEKSTAAADEKS